MRFQVLGHVICNIMLQAICILNWLTKAYKMVRFIHNHAYMGLFIGRASHDLSRLWSKTKRHLVA